MDESVVKHLQEAKIGMSSYLRRGIPLCKPAKHVFFGRDCACAIGTALAGYYGSLSEGSKNRWSHAVNGGGCIGSASRLFGVPHEVVAEVNSLYESGEMTREQIADWLEAQGL